ncbi:MAG: DUF6691 family protein [Aestuariivirga sp.]
MKNASALLAGLVFGLGIVLSGMGNPAKVINFFDVAGTFDPSLIFVMAGGMLTAMAGYALVFRKMKQPLYDSKFNVPTSKQIDTALVAGSATFGVGWGISGFCPGGAIPVVGLGDSRIFLFVAAMCAGLAIAKLLKTGLFRPAKA